MGTDHLILILAAEALIACVFITILVLLKNRNLRRLVAQLQERIQRLSDRCRDIVSPSHSQPSTATDADSYSDRINQQLESTKDYHHSLGSRQDIALDLDPDAPLPRRTAALRHAFLIAEKEAVAETDESTNWDFLAVRYQQLLSFHEDYAPTDDNHTAEQIAQAQEDLQLARKRIDNLERFKTMYFELEERWEHCKGQADQRYAQLQAMTQAGTHGDDFRSLLADYHASYAEIDAIIAAGANEGKSSAASPDSQLQELRRLRSVAAEQHRIISELQNRLTAAPASEEQAIVLESLQNELKKQSRFLQESETCIQQMEDELANANRERQQLRARASEAARLRTEVEDLKESAATDEQIAGSLKEENRRLTKKLKSTQEAAPEDNHEAHALRKQLSSLLGKYNDLEEKFLNLKLKE